MNETHVVHTFKPHRQYQQALNQSHLCSSKFIVSINPRYVICNNYDKINNTPDTSECICSKVFGLHYKYKCVQDIDSTANNDC